MSAIVKIEGKTKIEGDKIPNDELLRQVRAMSRDIGSTGATLVVEMIAFYGNDMHAGGEVFETCVMIGRIIEAWHPNKAVRMYRREVKSRLCGSMKAKDPHVRQVIIDRFGGKDAAIGLKKSQGPLYRFHSDLWAALAVGMTYLDMQQLTPVCWSPKAIGQTAMGGLSD